MAHHNDLNTPLIALVGFLSALLTFLVIVAVQVLFYHAEQSEFAKKVVNVPVVAADNLIANQEAKLQEFGWLDRKTGKVAIPIDRAMELVVQEAQASTAKEPGHDT